MMELAALIHECAPNVGPNTVAAIMHVESSFRPTAIGYKVVAGDGGVLTLQRQPKDTAEAVSWAQWFVNNGYKFDAGIVQINSTNWARLGLTASNVFDTCTNIRAGGVILTEAYDRAVKTYGPGQKALYAAISAYNSGNFVTGFKNGYVAKVTAKAGGAIPTGVMPPLGGSAGIKPHTTSAEKVAAPEALNPYTASSAVTTFHKGWDKPTAWLPDSMDTATSTSSEDEKPEVSESISR